MRPIMGPHPGEHHGGPRALWGPRERPRKEVAKLGFLGLSTRILGVAKDSHDLYKDLAIIYGDFALIWIWI